MKNYCKAVSNLKVVLSVAAIGFSASAALACGVVTFDLPAKPDRGNLFLLEEAKVDKVFQGRWVQLAYDCDAKRDRSDDLIVRGESFELGPDAAVPFSAVRAYSDVRNAIEVEFVGLKYPKSQMFLQLSPDHKFLKTTKGGETAVDGGTDDQAIFQKCSDAE